MRIPMTTLLLLALSGCATDASRHCSATVGEGWARLTAAPPNAGSLLAMNGLPNQADALWYGKGEDQLVACIYANSLTNPGCGAATVYQYAKVQDRWTYRGTAMEACAPDF